MGARVLLVGSGGREHAIAWKLSQSRDVDAILVAPGNGGTHGLATNLSIEPTNIEAIVAAAREHRIDFYMATMDDPQPLGLVDRLRELGIPCYGPTAGAARIEASKAWSKQFMQRNGIPTPASRIFDRFDDAAAHVRSLGGVPLVVKASGLAAGKGAIVCDNGDEALAALEAIMVRREFGSAGDTVVIDERLYGWETSAHAFCDGRTARMMPFSSDHKRALDGDHGLNTGGMGACSPALRIDPNLAAQIRVDVVERTIAAMANEGVPFNGTLFPGLMITTDGVFVIEFNARFGDPEAQVLMPRLETDLFTIVEAASRGSLADVEITWSNEAAVGVVVASGGYPEHYTTGHAIHGLESVDPDVLVFHAGTSRRDGRVVTAGGRVLTVVGRGATIDDARRRAYDNVRRISFEGAHYRTDIAAAETAAASPVER